MERRRKQRGQALRELGDLGWTDAIVVGCFQVLALVPGASRSGSTITGGLFLGMKRDTAARFSFLLSLPAVAAAGIFELRKLHAFARSSVSWWRVFAAFVVGYIVVALSARLLAPPHDVGVHYLPACPRSGFARTARGGQARALSGFVNRRQAVGATWFPVVAASETASASPGICARVPSDKPALHLPIVHSNGRKQTPPVLRP